MLYADLPSSMARPLPVADDQCVDADLDVALSTPLTLVVNAQLETSETGQPHVDLALVIPRSQCRGERPQLAALLHAVQAAIARATRGGTRHHPRRVFTQVGGQPHLIAQF